MNVVDCKGTGTHLTFGNGNTSDIARNTDGATKMGIRPEHMALCDANDASKTILTGQIDVMEHLGSDSFAYVNVPDVGLFTVRIVGHSDAGVGDTVGLHFASGDVHLFDASEKTIPA
jgi:multiple sugar transport system ATP-binding protein